MGNALSNELEHRNQILSNNLVDKEQFNSYRDLTTNYLVDLENKISVMTNAEDIIHQFKKELNLFYSAIGNQTQLSVDNQTNILMATEELREEVRRLGRNVDLLEKDNETLRFEINELRTIINERTSERTSERTNKRTNSEDKIIDDETPPWSDEEENEEKEDNVDKEDKQEKEDNENDKKYWWDNYENPMVRNPEEEENNQELELEIEENNDKRIQEAYQEALVEMKAEEEENPEGLIDSQYLVASGDI